MECASPPRGGRGKSGWSWALLLPLVLVPATSGGAQSPPRREAPAAPFQAATQEASAAPEPQLAAAARRAGEIEITGAQLQVQGPETGQLVISADQPLATYESFYLPEPPRVVVDIPGAVHAIKEPIAVPPDGPVTRIRSSQYKERPVPVVRFVADLRSGLPYRVESAGNQLRVYIGGQVAQQAPSAPALAQPPAVPAPAQIPAAAPPAAPAAGKVTRVDVRVLRGRSRISIATTGKVAFNITEVSDPPSLVLDIADALIEPRAARAIEIRQAASPLERVRAAQFRQDGGRTVRVIADLRAPTKYEVAQVGSVIQLDLIGQGPAQAAAPPAPSAPRARTAQAAPAPAAAPLAAAPPAGEQARISMDFKDADINNLLRIIAEVSGLNVVAGQDVQGKVTVRLVNVEWEQALDLILKINNLAYERDGNVIRVASQANLQREREARARSLQEEARARVAQRQAAVALDPLQFRIIPVNYAKAADLIKQITPLRTPGRPDANITVDDRTNSLIITELPAVISRVEALLKTLDRPTPQVMIEARLVEAEKDFAQSLGVQWGGGMGTQIADPGLKGFPQTMTLFGTSAAAGNVTVPTTFQNPQPNAGTSAFGTAGGPVPAFVNFPAAISGVSSIPAIGFLLGSITQSRLIGLQLSAAETENKVRTLSAPKVMTLDNVEAEVRQGTQVPYTTIDSSGRTVVAFQDAFIRLKVTPHITNDRRISMKVEAERTFPGARIDFAGGFAFPLNQRKATTNVLVTNGGTIVIGGLLQTNENYSESRVPFLANIPFLGQLFKNKNIGPDSRIELLIFMTPTIAEEARLS